MMSGSLNRLAARAAGPLPLHAALPCYCIFREIISSPNEMVFSHLSS